MRIITAWRVPAENDPALTARVQANTEDLLGPGAEVTGRKSLWAERTFASFLGRCRRYICSPAAEMREKFHAVPLHNPAFRLDEAVLPVTAAVFAYNALRLLEA